MLEGQEGIVPKSIGRAMHFSEIMSCDRQAFCRLRKLAVHVIEHHSVS